MLREPRPTSAIAHLIDDNLSMPMNFSPIRSALDRVHNPCSRFAVILLAILQLTSCRTHSTSGFIHEDISHNLVDLGALSSRHLRCEDSSQVLSMLSHFLNSLGPAVSEKTDATARITLSRGGTSLLKWTESDDEIHFVAIDLYDGSDGRPRELIASLDYHMRCAGIVSAFGGVSGSRVSDSVPRQDLSGILDAVFAAQGAAPIGSIVGVNWVQYCYGAYAGSVRWHVDVTLRESGGIEEIDVVNGANPFEDASEEHLLREILAYVMTGH